MENKHRLDDVVSVKNPSHYQINGLGDSMDIIIKIVKHNTSDTEEGIYLFNTLKYLFRFGNKDGERDLRKARNYLEILIEKRKKNERERGGRC